MGAFIEGLAGLGGGWCTGAAWRGVAWRGMRQSLVGHQWGVLGTVNKYCIELNTAESIAVL